MSRDKLSQLREQGYDFNIENILQRGFRMFMAQPILSISYTLLIITLQLLFALYLSEVTFLYALFLAPPLFSGFYFVANKISLGERVVYSDFFKGFGVAWAVISIWLIGQILTALGIFALVIPGIYLAVAYSFSVLMSIFGGFDFWTALEESRKLITVKWWKFFAFSLILLAINLIGLFPLGLLLPVSIPVTFYSTYVLFEDLTRDIFSE
ncbi:hypothetical protein [Cecembia rubra]|uniref:Uncharacterized protein n=1 Tax=Cecembia rubra TaxID=1485585 RepID=A0A2P8E9U7_9BACT|nr:hypothetical protein [Cecembia rubra]PSL06220.1 hypothetical protein CLV48_10234 [Cecembia rubra]